MSTVLKPEPKGASPSRIRADEVKVGDWVSRLKGGPYEEVIATIPNEKTVWLHLRVSVAGQPIGFHQVRPRHTTKLWVKRN